MTIDIKVLNYVHILIKWGKLIYLQKLNSLNELILIFGKDDYVKTKERWEILKEFFQIKNIEYNQVCSANGSILTKLVCLVYFLDYVSIYRAILSKIDPSPVTSIDFIKKKL